MNTLDEYWAEMKEPAGLAAVGGDHEAVKPLFYLGAFATHQLMMDIMRSDTLTDEEMRDAVKKLRLDIDEFHVRLGEKAVKLKKEMDKPKPEFKPSLWKGIIASCGVWFVLISLMFQLHENAPFFMLCGCVAYWLADRAGYYVVSGKFKKP